MKLLCLMAGLGLLSCAAVGQTGFWHRPPFRAGATCQPLELNTPGDTTHTLQARYQWPFIGANGDSLCRFSGRAGVATRTTAAYPGQTHIVRPDGIFGATMGLHTGPYGHVLQAANGRTFTLRLKVCA